MRKTILAIVLYNMNIIANNKSIFITAKTFHNYYLYKKYGILLYCPIKNRLYKKYIETGEYTHAVPLLIHG